MGLLSLLLFPRVRLHLKQSPRGSNHVFILSGKHGTCDCRCTAARGIEASTETRGKRREERRGRNGRTFKYMEDESAEKRWILREQMRK